MGILSTEYYGNIISKELTQSRIPHHQRMSAQRDQDQ